MEVISHEYLCSRNVENNTDLKTKVSFKDNKQKNEKKLDIKIYENPTAKFHQFCFMTN